MQQINVPLDLVQTQLGPEAARRLAAYRAAFPALSCQLRATRRGLRYVFSAQEDGHYGETSEFGVLADACVELIGELTAEFRRPAHPPGRFQ